MMIIRAEQLAVFQQVARINLENALVAEFQAAAPTLSAALGEPPLRLAVQLALAAAAEFGLQARTTLRLVVELRWLLGSAVLTDPQYQWLADSLRTDAPEPTRAASVYEQALAYHATVIGAGAELQRTARQHFMVWLRQPFTLTGHDFGPAMMRVLTEIDPLKAGLSGEPALQAVVRSGYALARERSVPTLRGYSVLISLMFLCGHGCIDDPLWLWIGATLNDASSDIGQRMERLEALTLAWLEQATATPAEGIAAVGFTPLVLD
ncbi:hypothetical protein CKO12_07175 [Chromatium okenii]|uniref:hypothetical protein n=1 Tax=Chromatium okenii TaxID=61644 RepID=UPI001905264B|nr:hypothetical protein [Chromatium okenii]MBK1641660.1 hypothetical protein [Chromatium okenii]